MHWPAFFSLTSKGSTKMLLDDVSKKQNNLIGAGG